MSDEDKLTRYSGLCWDDETPVNVNINTLKQLGQQLQKKQDINYNSESDELVQYMKKHHKESRVRSQQSIKKSQLETAATAVGVRRNNNNKQIENSMMSEYLENSMVGTPNERLFKLQILKKDNQLPCRQYDIKERRINYTHSNRYSLMNSKHSLFEKLRSYHHQESYNDIPTMIEEEKKHQLQIQESQIQLNHISSTDLINSGSNLLLNAQKQKQEEQQINDVTATKQKQDMQAKATTEFRRRINSVLNEKNKEFVRQFTLMKNESKLKQSEVYQKILEFYNSKQKIDPNEIQLYKDVVQLNHHQKNSRELHMQEQTLIKKSQSKNDISSFQANNNNNNNNHQIQSARVSRSAQSQRMNGVEKQTDYQEEVQINRKRYISQANEYNKSDVANYANIQLKNSMQVVGLSNQAEVQYQDQYKLHSDRSKYMHDQQMNHSINRRIFSTLRIHKQSSNKVHAYAQHTQPPSSNETSANKQDNQTQTNFTIQVRSKTRSPIKINRLQVVDSYQKTDRQLITPNRSDTASPIEDISKNNIDQETTNHQNTSSNSYIDKIKRLQIRNIVSSRQNNKSQQQLTNILQNSQNKIDPSPITFNQPIMSSTSSIKQQQLSMKANNYPQEINDQDNNSSQNLDRKGQFHRDGISFNLAKQIQSNIINSKQKQQLNQKEQQIADHQTQMNQNLIKQSYSLTHHHNTSSFMRNKIAQKDANVSSLSSKLFTQIKERVFMN